MDAYGELALDHCMRDWGGFEGNAQTLRILAVLEKKETRDGGAEGLLADGTDERAGLNLTFRSLASVLKYDRPIPIQRPEGGRVTKGYYESEKSLVTAIKSHVAPGYPAGETFKTLECQIMDLADDIAYSTYDLEDGLKGGFLDPLMLHQIVRSDRELAEKVRRKVEDSRPNTTLDDIRAALETVLHFSQSGYPTDAPDTDLDPLNCYHLAKVFGEDGYSRVALTSEIVNTFVSGVKIVDGFIDQKYPWRTKVAFSDDILLLVETLKHLNYEVTIMSPRLKLVEYRGYEIVKFLFQTMTRENGHELLPKDLRIWYLRLRSDAEKKRLICDFIAGMTDRYAMEFYGRLRRGDQSIFKPF